MPSLVYDPANQLDNMSSQVTGLPKVWVKGFNLGVQATDFFGDAEGRGKQFLINTGIDKRTSKLGENGMTINFKELMGFYGEPYQGDEYASESEQLYWNDNELTADFNRHRVDTDLRMPAFMGIRAEIEHGLNVNQGEWLGRLRTERAFMQFLHRTHKLSHVFEGGVSNIDGLRSAHTLSAKRIRQTAAVQRGFGVMPAKVAKRGRNSVKSFVFIPNHEVGDHLRGDDDYKELLERAGHRGAMNERFTGHYVDLDGQGIWEYENLSHDGHGAVGSPIGPYARLGVAIGDGTTAPEIKCHATDTKTMFFKYFPGHAYQFRPGDVVDPTSSSYPWGAGPWMIGIYNPTESALGGDAGKWGFYDIAVDGGNLGYKLVTTSRLGATATGDAVTTLGNITWDAGVWTAADWLTTAHPVGALVFPVNKSGVVPAPVPSLGASGLMRGYGPYVGRRFSELHDGGFRKARYIMDVFGDKIRTRRDDLTPQAYVTWCAWNPLSVTQPNIT